MDVSVSVRIGVGVTAGSERLGEVTGATELEAVAVCEEEASVGVLESIGLVANPNAF